MLKSKSLTAIVLAAFLSIGTITFSGCSSQAEIESRNQARVQRQIEEKKAEDERIQGMYDNSFGFAHYQVPQVELTAKKVSYTLSLSAHLGNELKAQTIGIPVSQEYYDSVEVGQEIDSKFNTTELLLGDGNIERYKISVSAKKYTDMYCIFDGEDSWSEIDDSTYEQLLQLNELKKRFKQRVSQEIYIVPGKNGMKDLFLGTARVEIESYKTNFTLDPIKHLANYNNKMRYTVDIPKFLAKELKEGDVIDKNFVGGSLFFSRSLSSVSFKVKSVSNDN